MHFCGVTQFELAHLKEEVEEEEENDNVDVKQPLC